MTPELATSSPNFHPTLTGGRLNLDTFSVHRPHQHVVLKSRLTTSPLVRLVERKERWDATDNSQGALSQNWDATKPNHNITL
ncbi:hypothetical protein TNCV_585671 [Trichonephila clavipes]|nr:hypothetical protein TNCV_585671 [Trichonephila clavipes]